MLAAERYLDLFVDAALPNHKLLEVHRSKISLHYAKTGYNYPTIRLPHTFSKLAGLTTRVYQTIHNGALAFLVMVLPVYKAAEKSEIKSENASKSAKSLRLHILEVAGSNPAEPIVLFRNEDAKNVRCGLLGTRIVAKKKHNQEKKLLNSLHNSDITDDDEPDLNWHRGDAS